MYYRTHRTTASDSDGDDDVTPTTPATSPRRGGPRDPGRRDRIIDAAITVIVRQGVGALTHRAAASEAGVPLGSTTYHFADLDELVRAALTKATEQFHADLRVWAEQLEHADDPATAIVDKLAELSGPMRQRVVMRLELARATLRYLDLGPLYTTWVAEVADAFGRRFDELTARTLAVLLSGFLSQIVTADAALDRAEVDAIVRRVIDGR